eukprot:Gb_08840 [translate_table: standard]
MANKYAVLAGCNYPNTKNELHGCVNDVLRMRRTLIHRFGFPKTNIDLLIDTNAEYAQPTGQNIRQALINTVHKSKPGDVVFFHYSGHGTFIPAKNGHRRGDHRYEECIVPCDFNLLTDEDFRLIVNQVPDGATFTIMSDSCNSGGLIDKEKEQIGPDTVKHPRGSKQLGHNYFKSKFLPLDSLLEILKEKTGDVEIGEDEIRVALFHLFGEEASSNVKSHANSLLRSLGANKETKENAAAISFLRKHLDESHGRSEYAKTGLAVGKGVDYNRIKRVRSDMGILLSGCQSDETSADANPTGHPRGAYGAFTNSIEKILSRHSKPISNRELVMSSRKLLQETGYSQHPCLYCSDQNADAAFLCQGS